MHVAGPNHIAAQVHQPHRTGTKPAGGFEPLHFQKVAGEPAGHAKPAPKPGHGAEAKSETASENNPASASQTGSETHHAAAHERPAPKPPGSQVDIRV
jgi:hypothetical protein